jgi:hypothetical protein
MELMKIITSSFQRLQLIALRSDPRAKVAFTQASIAISSTFFMTAHTITDAPSAHGYQK